MDARRTVRWVAIPLCCLSLLALALPGHAAESKYWNVATGNWDIGSNWSPNGAPGSDDTVYVRNGGTATIRTSHPAVWSTLYVGHSGGDSGGVTQTGSDSSGGNLYVGYGAQGTYTLSGGTLDVSSGVHLGYGASGEGKLTQSGGTLEATDLWIGKLSGAAGTYSLSGGTCDLAGLLYVAGAGTTGYMGISGSATCAVGSDLLVAPSGGTGELELKSSTCTLEVAGGARLLRGEKHTHGLG